jgi:dsDNA-specific endonuclease/ATPase MutS2
MSKSSDEKVKAIVESTQKDADAQIAAMDAIVDKAKLGTGEYDKQIEQAHNEAEHLSLQLQGAKQTLNAAEHQLQEQEKAEQERIAEQNRKEAERKLVPTINDRGVRPDIQHSIDRVIDRPMKEIDHETHDFDKMIEHGHTG